VDLSDEALVLNFRQTKDPAHFKALVHRYENRIFSAVYRILGNAEEAEEVVQDTFLKLHQHLEKFKSSSSFASWIFRIAHNSCMDRMRIKHRRRKIFQFWSFDPQSANDKEAGDEIGQVIAQAADPGMSPSEVLDASEQEIMIEKSLKALPDTQRVVVILHDIEGFSYQEIAEIIGSNIGTVRSRLHYGRLKLRELLEPYFEQPDIAPASR
jgi:RNA polymerase sigma-70 factor (ECF subfamily)